MAQIEITPLNISGVKVPFNLLDNLLGQNVDIENLVYPIDLATNPQYCHAIQFTVYDYSYPAIEAAYSQASGLFSTGMIQSGGALGKIYNDFINAQVKPLTPQGAVGGAAAFGGGVVDSLKNLNFTSMFSEVKGGLEDVYKNTNLTAPFQSALQGAQNITNLAPAELENAFRKYGNLFQPSTYMNRNVERLASISLYMPDSLNTNITSNYDSVNLTDTFSIAGYGANLISDYLKNRDALSSGPKNIISDDAQRGLAGNILGAAGDAFKSPNLGLVIGNALKRVPNPQVQLLYRGLELRQFQFDFTFTPASQKEADEVDQIIKTFTYYSLPKLTSGMNGQYFIPPQIFGIKFAFMGSDGVAGQIFDVLKNNIGNLLGNQFSKIVSGSNPSSDIANAKTAKIFEIGECALTDVQVNYAPNGWASYTDGYPVQTTVSLTFKEINLINKDSPGVKPRKVFDNKTNKL